MIDPEILYLQNRLIAVTLERDALEARLKKILNILRTAEGHFSVLPAWMSTRVQLQAVLADIKRAREA